MNLIKLRGIEFTLLVVGSLIGCGGGNRSTDVREPEGGTGNDSGSGGDSEAGAKGGTTSKGGSSGRSGSSGSAGTAGSGSPGAGAAGRAGMGGTSGGTAGMSGSGGKGGRPMGQGGDVHCADSLPANAPKLKVGDWVDITPPGLRKYQDDDIIAQGITLDPCNPAVIYWCNTPFDEDKNGGLYRSTDAGATWIKMGDRSKDPEDHFTTFLDEPLHLRINPDDHLHMYAGDGVRGATLGFWESLDGGHTWTKPESFPEIAGNDIYDVAVNPTDFDHVLVSFHSVWDGDAAGIVESKDGGDTWKVHMPRSSWGTGHSIRFLYDPGKGIGNASTWLLGTQGNGYWRTADAGATWKQVSPIDIFHGGGTTYYSSEGVLYASGSPRNLRSTDNGATWTEIGPERGYTCIFGDGAQLWTGMMYTDTPEPMLVSPETDGLSWTAYAGGTQEFQNGPYDMVIDSKNRILYQSNWGAGVWAMKLPDP